MDARENGDGLVVSVSVRVSDVLTAAIAECSAFAQSSCVSPEIADELLRLLEAPAEFIRADAEAAGAAGAGEHVVVFEPSDRLLDLLSAMRAWNV